MSNTDAAGETGAAMGEAASTAAETVRQEAQSFAAQARDKAAGQIEQHKETATRALGDFANAVRRAGDELAQTDQSAVSRVVQQAAEGLEGLSRSVSDKRPEELLDAVRDFGRRNPTAFIAGAALVGLAVGRFLKSSAEPRTTTLEASFVEPNGQPPNLALLDTGVATADEVTESGATSIGAPAAELGSGEVGVEALTGDVLAEDLDESRGAADGDDRDRARFGDTGV